MMETPANMHDLLLALPLFQGMSHDDLNQVMTYTRLDFRQYNSNSTIASSNTTCHSLLFLLRGQARAIGESHDHGYKFVEFLQAPCLLQVERLFGLQQRYTRTFTAERHCHVLCLQKREVMTLADNFSIFRINLLNIISTQAQKLSEQSWTPLPHDRRQRIVRFIGSHCLRPAGKKVFYIKMNRIAAEINESRLHVSQELHQMQDAGLLFLQRGIITIPAFELLIT